MPNKVFYLLSFLCGASLPFGFAPLAFWPLAIISPLLFFVLIDKHQKLIFESSKLASKSFLYLVYSFWLGFYVLGVSWVYVSIHEYGYTPAPIAAALALFFAVGLTLVNSFPMYFYQKLKLHKLSLISFPALWLVIEWFRTWFLTGFPWLLNGYAFIDSPLSAYASLGGVYLVSFLSILLSLLIFFAAKEIVSALRSKGFHTIKMFGALSLIIFISTGALTLNKHTWVDIDKSKALNVHLVQGNIPQHDKWLPENQRKILKIYDELIKESFTRVEEQRNIPSKLHAQADQQLIILPEAAMPALQSELLWYFNIIDRKAKEKKLSLVSGIFYDEDYLGFYAEKIYNSITVVGKGSGLYHKQRLVPFGEYVPLEDFIRGLIPFFDLPFSSFTRGEANQSGLSLEGIKIAPFICYEILYPELVFKQAKNADVLLTISNDAWFGNSSGPKQHFQMARMRALETGKYLIRATNTGTTAIIDPKGQVTDILKPHERAILSGFVYATQGNTPYSLYGNKPILIFCALLLILATVLSNRQKSP
jgi:apolipoprotein N-acyltransferase